MTSFGLYVGMLNNKNTLEVSKEFDFYHVLISSFCLDNAHAKTADMHAKLDVVHAEVFYATSTLGCDTLALQDSLIQQSKCIKNLQRNFENCQEKVQTLQDQLHVEFACLSLEGLGRRSKMVITKC